MLGASDTAEVASCWLTGSCCTGRRRRSWRHYSVHSGWLERSVPIGIATTDRNDGWLRAALGVDVRHCGVCDSSQRCRHPVRALAALHDVVQAVSAGGERLRMIAEAVVDGLSRKRAEVDSARVDRQRRARVGQCRARVRLRYLRC